MSADNWAKCPRCTKRELARLDAENERVQALYGTVPIEKFDQIRSDLAIARRASQSAMETFREDYEIYGAATGTVSVCYSGHCDRCGLTLNIKEERKIPGWDEP